MDNPLDEALNNDLAIVLKNSPLLWEAWNGLPEDQRAAVVANWNKLIWDSIMMAAAGKPMGERSQEWPLTIGHDIHSMAGQIRVGRQDIPLLHEYVAIPTYGTVTKEIVSWSLVHRSRALSKELLDHISGMEGNDDPEASASEGKHGAPV